MEETTGLVGSEQKKLHRSEKFRRDSEADDAD